MARPRKQNRPRSGGTTAPRGRGQGRDQRGGGGRAYLEPPTARQLGRQTRAAANQRFRPLERAIGAEKRASERRVGEVGDWFNNYLQTVNQGRTETQAAYDKAAATGQAQIAQASAVDNANTATLNEEAAKSAALRGANTSTAPQERAAAAQAQRNYLAAAQGNATAQAGANQYAYLTDQARIGTGQSIASRLKEQARTREKEQDRATTRRERGDFAVTDRAKREEKAREYLLQRGAFGLDKRTAAQDAAQARADAARAERENREDNAQDERASRRSNRGGGKEQQEARAEFRTEIRKAAALLRRAEKGDYDSLASAVDYLVGEGISPRAAKAAVKRVRRNQHRNDPALNAPPAGR